ncbi:TPA: cylX protein [Streptococcus agalactiae]
MGRSNILSRCEQCSDNQCSLYKTRLKDKLLLVVQLVGNIRYSEFLTEGGVYHKGETLLEVITLGISYEYKSYGDIKVIKKYCADGSVVDYNMPILLMERIE